MFFGNNNCLWIVLILIVLCCCGNGFGCGCDRDRFYERDRFGGDRCCD